MIMNIDFLRLLFLLVEGVYGEAASDTASDGGPRNHDANLFGVLLLTISGCVLLAAMCNTAMMLYVALVEIMPKKKSQVASVIHSDGRKTKAQMRKSKKGAANRPGPSKLTKHAPVFGEKPLKIKAKHLWIRIALCVIGCMVLSRCSNAIGNATADIGAFDPYATLGVESGASRRTIKKKFRELALQWHPDKNTEGRDREAVKRKFVKINKAAKMLLGGSDIAREAHYVDPEDYQYAGLPSLVSGAGAQKMIIFTYGCFFAVGLPFAFFKLQSVFMHDKVSSFASGGMQADLNDMSADFSD